MTVKDLIDRNFEWNGNTVVHLVMVRENEDQNERVALEVIQLKKKSFSKLKVIGFFQNIIYVKGAGEFR